MTEDDDQRDGDGEENNLENGDVEEAKKEGKKKILLILVPLLLILSGSAAAYFTGLLDSVLGVAAVEEAGHGGEKKKHGDDDEQASVSAFLPIPTMIVNLNTEDAVPRYLRLTVQLELENPDEKEAVAAIIPRVIDQFQTYLRELRVRDLRGSAGIYRLQMELLWRVNQAAAPMDIKDVLFQEILIQ